MTNQSFQKFQDRHRRNCDLDSAHRPTRSVYRRQNNNKSSRRYHTSPALCTPIAPFPAAPFAAIAAATLFYFLRFPLNLPLPLGDRALHLTHGTYGLTESYPKRHPDRFSRFYVDSKCYVVQCIVNGEEKTQNFPFSLGFRHPASQRSTEPRP